MNPKQMLRAFGTLMGSLLVGWIVSSPPQQAVGVQLVQIAQLAGVSGSVTTLECYDPEPTRGHPSNSSKPDPFAPCRTTNTFVTDTVTGAHPGAKPTDISASPGTTAYLQLDYLPSALRGGYVWMSDMSSGTFCFNHASNSNKYVGRKIYALVYYYDNASSSQSTDWSEFYGEHVDANSPHLNQWRRWNNKWATYPLWVGYPTQDFFLDWESNTGAGASVGTVAAIGSAPDAGCASGTHLHQDIDGSHSGDWDRSKFSEGCRSMGNGVTTYPCNPSSGWTWVAGQSVTSRYSDIQYFKITIH